MFIWIFNYIIKKQVGIENTVYSNKEIEYYCLFLNFWLFINKMFYSKFFKVRFMFNNLQYYIFILIMPESFNLGLANNLDNVNYITFYSYEFFFFILILCLIVHSLFYRFDDLYVRVAYVYNIMVCLLLILLFVAIFFTGDMFIGAKVLFNSGLLINYFTSYAKLFIIGLALIFLLIIQRFSLSTDKKDIDFVDYPLLIALSVFFMVILVSSFDLMVLYIAIEGLSILLYILAMFPFKQSSIEASIKYYSLGALSSGILLFGISLMYGLTGALDFLSIKAFFLFESWVAHSMFYLMVLSFIFGFLFKLSAFPCHMWAPDVYEGTWLPTTVFFMTVVKLALFFTFARFLVYFFYYTPFLYQNILLISAIGSLLIGSLGSLYQQGLKRLLAYASISQVGFALFGLWCHSIEGIISSLVFFTIYIFVSLAIFAILLNVESFYKGDSLLYISDLSCFSRFNISISAFLSIFLLSMAGIPPLSGFFSKVFIFISTTGLFYYGFTIGIIFLSTINAFVYFKLIKILWSDRVDDSILEDSSGFQGFFFIENWSMIGWGKIKHDLFITWRHSFGSFDILYTFLAFVSFFVSFFIFFISEYLIFCSHLSISLIDIWY